MNVTEDTQVFYIPGKPGVIDFAKDVDGELLSLYGGKTLSELASEYPGVAIGKLGDVSAQSEAMFRTNPVEITEDRWMEMLEVLPPVSWKRGANAETFKLSERTYGAITAIFCRIGDRYFELSDDIHRPHDAIVAQVRKAYF